MVRFYTYLEIYLDDLNKEVSLSEFENHFKTPHQTIKKHLLLFTKMKILREEKKERFRFYKLNLENSLTFEYLTLCEKERLFNFLEGSALFSRLYHELSPFFSDAKILVFGSAAQKKDFIDIDLLILSKNKDMKTILKKFQETYSVKIHTTQAAPTDMTMTFIQEIRQKHVILNNHDYFVGLLYK